MKPQAGGSERANAGDTPIARVFIDWKRAALQGAAAWVLDHAGDAQSPSISQGVLDLRQTLCVLPGARAGALFLAQMLDQCEQRGMRLIPPRTLTPGSMVDEILKPEGAPANDAEVAFAWLNSLRGCDAQAIKALIPSPPGEDDMPGWHALATTIAGLHAELAGQRLSFADVAAHTDRLSYLNEGDRWRVLKGVLKLYQREMESAGLVDPNEARELALKKFNAARCEFDGVAIIGNVDLNALQRSVATLVADRLAVVVFAPVSLADHFDDLGCVITERWENRTIALDESQIVRAERPEDQCRAVMQRIASFDGKYSAQQITIGLGDAELSAGLQRAAKWAGLFAHDPAGTKLDRSAPARFLDAAADYLTRKHFADLATLLRHPDVEAAVRRDVGEQTGVEDWLSLLDEYFSEHLHARVSGKWLGKEDRQANLKAVYESVGRLLAPLSGGARPMGQWCDGIISMLASLYEGCDKSDQSTAASLDACERIARELQILTSCPDSLQPTLDAPTALRMVISQLAGAAIPSHIQTNQIEMLGWLEVPLDPAPALIISGCNDGLIPQTISPDGFLPDVLRSTMGLSSNARRYARDAYLLSMIVANRPSLTIITGRRTVRGEPLAPSRLLLACDEATLVKRVKLICADHASPPTDLLPLGTAGLPAAKTLFTVPALRLPLTPPTSMRVTAFRAYLECPYRFALKHLLKLDAVDDCATELDPMSFGNLAHEVLCEFGKTEDIANSTNAEAIEKFLISRADRRAKQKFGTEPMPAVRLQMARLHQRLMAFARLQAQLRSDGWVITACEKPFDQQDSLDIPGQEAMGIRGKIDRIDRNERTGEWLIVDYKTGESGDSPHKIHHGREKLDADPLEWLDLQLPLYQHLASRDIQGGAVRLGYIVLPKRANGAELRLAQWTNEQVLQGVECARYVVRDIRDQKFEMNPDFHSAFDDLARICQTQAFSDDDSDDETGGSA